MFFTKNYIPVRVKCLIDPYAVETVYVYGIPRKQSFEPLFSNGCDSLHGGEPCKRCCAGIVSLLRSDLSLLEDQPISPIRENS